MLEIVTCSSRTRMKMKMMGEGGFRPEFGVNLVAHSSLILMSL